MPTDNDRLDAAINAALAGRGRDALHRLISGLFRAKTEATVRTLEPGAPEAARPRAKIVRLG